MNDCLAKFHLNISQIVVLKSKRTMVRESDTLVEQFLMKYQEASGSTIFSDNGKAFVRAGEHVIERIPTIKAATYPAVIHQFLSPNDSHHHGRAKAKYRSMCSEKGWISKDPVAADLFLLHCLTHDKSEDIQSDFRRNFFLDQPLPHRATCISVINESSRLEKGKATFFSFCRWEYMRHMENKYEEEQTQ